MDEKIVKDSQCLAKDLVNDCISRKAAIDIVNKYNKSHMILWGKPMVGAAPIVIELEELPPVQPELPDICVGDIISRQAAIDEVINLWVDKPFGNPALVEIKDCIEKLPPAQPEKRTDKRTETHACDCISRQAAIRIASGYCHPANIADELAKLPPVQPERKTAHWIEGRTDDPKTHNILCSNCFEGYPSRGHANSFYTSEKFKYCPHCGAKMEKEVEE